MGTWFRPSTILATALMLGTGFLALFVEAAPLGLAADARPSPDLVFCVVACWAVRRPAAAALPAVFALGLARDLLTDLPVGIGALTLVAASEVLRFLSPVLARRGFTGEWAAVAFLMAAASLLQWLAVLILLAHPPYLSDLGVQWVFSAALYPALALVLRAVFRGGNSRGAAVRS